MIEKGSVRAEGAPLLLCDDFERFLVTGTHVDAGDAAAVFSGIVLDARGNDIVAQGRVYDVALEKSERPLQLQVFLLFGQQKIFFLTIRNHSIYY